MGLTLPEAMKRTRNMLFAGMLKEIVTTDELANVLPMSPVESVHDTYRREGTLPSTEYIGDDGTATEESTGTDDNVTVPLRRIVGNLDVDAFADDLTGQAGPGTQRGVHVAKKAKTTWRLVKDKFVNGAHVTGHTLVSTADPFAAITSIDFGPWLDSSRYGPGEIRHTAAGTLWEFRGPGDITFGPPVAAAADGSFTLFSFNKSRFITVTLDVSLATVDGRTTITFQSTSKESDGLKEIIGVNQTIDPTGANGDAFDLAMLDKLITNEKIRINRAFFMPGELIEKFYASYRALGGADPGHVVLPNYGTPVPTYRGIPLLQNDNVLLDETNGSNSDNTSIYIASLDSDEGLSLAVANQGNGEVPGGLNVDADPRDQIVMGFRIVDLGERDELDARRIRVKHYSAPRLKSTLALVRRRGVLSA